MVVCKYFLQGNCRFGDHCKFDHQIGDNFNNSQKHYGSSILRQPQLTNPQYQNTSTQYQNTNHQYQSQSNSIFQKQNSTPNIFNAKANDVDTAGVVDVDTLVKSVIKDMHALEAGGQWLLSCYGPFKEKPVFPGFEDYSFEEIRTGFYEAIKNGSAEQYKQYISGLLQQAMLRIKSLQKPTPEIGTLLKQIYDTPVQQSSSTSGSIFGNTNTTFNQTPPTQNTSIFSPTNQNIFAKTAVQNIPLPSAPQPGTTGSLFGGNQAVTNQPSQNIFAQASANLAANKTPSIFGNQQPNTTTNSFSTPDFFAQPSAQTTIFGGNQSGIFQQQQGIPTSPSIFGNQISPQQFSQPPEASLPQTLNRFGENHNPQQTSIFAAANNPIQAQQGSLFGTQTTNNPSQFNSAPLQQQGSLFGNQPTSNSPFFQVQSGSNQRVCSGMFGANTVAPSIDESLYSKPGDLTEEEIQWFQSNDLDPMKIPEKPPTYELCF